MFNIIKTIDKMNRLNTIKTARILSIAGMLLLFMAIIPSCKDDKEGEGFPSMKWTLIETSEHWQSGKKFNIPTHGGIYTFECNMEFDICSIEYFDGKSSEYMFPNSNKIEIPEFVSISRLSGNKLMIQFYNNYSGFEKSISIETYFCNSFSSLEFSQKSGDS